VICHDSDDFAQEYSPLRFNEEEWVAEKQGEDEKEEEEDEDEDEEEETKTEPFKNALQSGAI